MAEKQIGLPIEVKHKYDNLCILLDKPKVPFTIVFESLIDYEFEMMNDENSYIHKTFYRTLKEFYNEKYSYYVDKNSLQSVIGVSVSAYDKYMKWLRASMDLLGVVRGVSYSLLDTLISIAGEGIAKNERFNEILENKFKEYYNFN
ncbi:MAG: hypothetical protein M0R17_07185 [Candidatus Omnitrophica bacterium]|jgi:hypothetical protein|nr:hypothetical protein [Candidatus Omnitrophota bacterium]